MKNVTMRKWLWLSLAVVALDQISKAMASSELIAYGPPVAVMPHVNLYLVYNSGAAFSLLAAAGGWQRWLLTIVAVLVVWFLVVWLGKLSAEQRLSAAAIALVIGGAIGNLIDRLLFGHVVDFIDLYYENHHWPTFNIADTAITVGVMLLIGIAVAYKEA